MVKPNPTIVNERISTVYFRPNVSTNNTGKHTVIFHRAKRDKEEVRTVAFAVEDELCLHDGVCCA